MNTINPAIQSTPRRDFLRLSTQGVGAAVAVNALAGPSIAKAANLSAANANLATSTELLQALGQRIGLEVADEIGAHGQTLQFGFIDHAGPATDALREGLSAGVRMETGSCGPCQETQGGYGALLGVAAFYNPSTEQRAKVAIFSSALSQIEMIADATASASLRKQAIMSAPSDALYSVQYFAS